VKVVLVTAVYGSGPRAKGGSGEQAGTAVEGAGQLHAACVVMGKRLVSSSSSSFPNTLNGLCACHLSSRLKHTHRHAT